jgi:hypothetical protein
MAYNPNNPNGQTTMANSSPVAIASDQTPLYTYPTNTFGYNYAWRSANYTTQQTGAAIWTPATNGFVGIFNLHVSSYATTAGRVIIWFGSSADTTYTAGTDMLVWAGSFAPSSTSRPGAIISAPFGIWSPTIDYVLKITTDAAISLDISVHGTESIGFIPN